MQRCASPGPPHSTTVDDLGDAVLELVFAAVCATPGGYRHCPAMPLVCRRWRDVYTQVCCGSSAGEARVAVNHIGLL